MSQYNILVVDDEKELRKLIVRYLKVENMEAVEACCGQEALKKINNKRIDLVILDIMMPDMDGFEVMTEIREQGYVMPVIFLTARKEDNDKVLGLGLGADDYVTKPFSPSELLARIKAQLRRFELHQAREKSHKIKLGPFVLNLNKYKLRKDNTAIDLSAREFQLLKFFMKNPGQVFTKNQLYEHVWNNKIVDENSVMVYIRHLRKKIEDDPSNPNYIKTIWGIGYQFSVEE